MRIALKNPKTYLVLLTDAGLLCFAYWLAYWLRFETFQDWHMEFFRHTIFPIVAFKLVVFYFYGLQSGMWRYTGVIDLINIIKASITSFVLIMAGLVYIYYPNFAGTVSRSVFIIDTMNTICLISLFRLSIRLFYSRVGSARVSNIVDVFSEILPTKNFGNKSNGIKVAIYGADDRGEHLLRSLINRPQNNDVHYNMVGFIDDNPQKTGVSIHGCPVLGSFDNLEELVKRFFVKELLVAARLDGEKIEKVYTVCKKLNVTCRVIPGYFDDSHQDINTDVLRTIQIEDLLFREPVTVDYSEIGRGLKNRKVLVTGAGGSIGGELVLQISKFNPSELILVDKGENYLHQLELKLDLKKDGMAPTAFYCSNVTDEKKMKRIFERHRPDVVFHAAAHKHVPMMERNKDEAIKNNIGGTKIIADLAEKNGVDKFILISTDKAVAPVNVMGATKRICELYMQEKACKSSTQFMAVRFGNVLASNGSVVPLFLSQIEKRGPVTVTHKDIERYFMTIHEAVLLILQAATLGRQGELFLLDMGEPVKIADLAEKMIRLAGFEPNRDIDIVFTGLREGEKLQEVLVGSGEDLKPTNHAKVRRVVNETKPWEGVEAFIKTVIDTVDVDSEEATASIVSWLNKESSAASDNVIGLFKKTSGR